jgi:hypothetical protein
VESDQVLQPCRRVLRFEFEPTGQPDMQHGKDAPGKLQLYVDGTLAGIAGAPVTTPSVLKSGCAHLRRQPRLRDQRRLRQPVQVHRHDPQRDGGCQRELIRDDEAELRVHMARQ